MRRVVLPVLLAAAALLRPEAVAACSHAAPCVDAEPMWLSPSAVRFALISDTLTPAPGQWAAVATLGFRLKPAVVVAPSPNAEGREINLIRYSTDLSLGARLGIGNAMELSLLLPAGLYQRGAGIKGVTHQSAPAISEQSLHDPRIGWGFTLVRSRLLSLKLRFEAKLPLGDREALMGESAPVASPTLATQWRPGNWFAASEAGLRLRTPSDFFGRRIGTQVSLALGAGYELPRPRLAFTLECFAAGSLVAHDNAPDVPAEWLASVRFTPQRTPRLSFGLAGGTGLALTHDAAGASSSGVGAPLFRALAFARFSPPQ